MRTWRWGVLIRAVLFGRLTVRGASGEPDPLLNAVRPSTHFSDGVLMSPITTAPQTDATAALSDDGKSPRGDQPGGNRHAASNLFGRRRKQDAEAFVNIQDRLGSAY